ncbi:MAG: chorismate mutase [Rhodocyclaceae bacterium]|nr:chorismate mutase [Rhodocyclaceae bacterium]
MYPNANQCLSLDDVRSQIDRIDSALVRLVAERGDYVRRAAELKTDPSDVPDPARVARVLSRVGRLAAEAGADLAVVEATWQAMIGAFIDAEQRLQARLHAHSPTAG